MKNVLIILDGKIAKYLLARMVDLNNNLNKYDIVYYDDLILPKSIPSNFTFYKFDPTSYSKLSFVLKKVLYQDALVVLNNKDDTLSVVKNIRIKYKTLNFTIYDQWDLKLNDENIKYYRGNDILSNGLVEQLPNIPVFAQNIGQRQGEIMEIKIPFGSNYAYRYIGSIGQKDWKIAALYRNDRLINIKPSLVLKPNDIIVVIGKPDVLTQVYSAISKSRNQFPMPFGNSIYIYIDLFIQSENEVLNAIEDSKMLHKRMQNSKLVIKITRPTTVEILDKINKSIENLDDVIVDMDYHNRGIQNILKTDKEKFDIGLVVLTFSLLNYKEAIKNIVSLKLPIFKVGRENISSLKSTLILINDNKIYEQISPILFDISSQLKIKPKIFDIDPIGDKKTEELISHLNNLSKIFNQNITIINEKSNPIKRLQKEKNVLQILPLNEEMFNKRNFKFLSTNSDLLSFDINKFNQILIPVVEELN
ncbi:MAG: TrkA C-terminal domain-containing protein [Campylobacterota bacterium]|nr:TrkA C-terminal domain-containing protein [Campylobacterota bacterium]